MYTEMPTDQIKSLWRRYFSRALNSNLWVGTLGLNKVQALNFRAEHPKRRLLKFENLEFCVSLLSLNSNFRQKWVIFGP